MTEPLVVVGAGGFGRETIDVVEAVNAGRKHAPWRLVGVVDDAPSHANLKRLQDRGVRFLGSVAELLTHEERVSYVIGVGAPAVRRKLVDLMDAASMPAATLIHPAATVGSEVSIGEGTVVCAGARVTTNIDIGRHVHINPNATVGHDTTLGDFVSLNPASSVSGDCVIEAETLIGVSGVVLNGLTVGRRATVGGCACVVRDVPADGVVKGVPAQ